MVGPCRGRATAGRAGHATPADPVSRLAALAAQYVGRRVRLRTGQTGTITRVTPQGFTVALTRITSADIDQYLD
jgi:hypothetical protein